MIESGVTIAALALAGVLGSALIAGCITLAIHLTKITRDNHLLYLWNRQLIDHIYKGYAPPPPGPPDGLFE